MNKRIVKVNGKKKKVRDLEYLNVEGEFNWFVDVEIKGDPGTLDSSIMITCYSKSNKKVVIANSYEWIRKGERGIEVVSGVSNYHKCSVYDLDAYVSCIISPVEEDFKGECRLIYGPIQMQNGVKNELEKAKGNNFIRIPIKGIVSSTGTTIEMIEAGENSIECLDENCQQVFTMKIIKQTQIEEYPKAPLKARIFNSTKEGMDLTAENSIDKYTFLIYIKEKVDEIRRNESRSMLSIQRTSVNQRQRHNPLHRNYFDMNKRNKSLDLNYSDSLRYIQNSQNYLVSPIDRQIMNQINSRPESNRNKNFFGQYQNQSGNEISNRNIQVKGNMNTILKEPYALDKNNSVFEPKPVGIIKQSNKQDNRPQLNNFFNSIDEKRVRFNYSKIEEENESIPEHNEIELQKHKKEIERLKEANKSLLREMEFINRNKKEDDQFGDLIRDEKEIMLQQQLTKINQKYTVSKRELGELKKLLEDKENTIQSVNQEVYELQNSNWELKLKLKEQEEQLEDLNENNSFLSKKLVVVGDEMKKKEIILFNQEDSLVRLENMKEEKQALDRRIERVKNDNLDLHREIEKMKEIITQDDEQISRLKETIFQKEQKELDFKIELDEHKELIDELRAQLTEKYKELETSEKKAVFEDKYDRLNEEYLELNKLFQEQRNQIELIEIERNKVEGELGYMKNQAKQDSFKIQKMANERVYQLEEEREQLKTKVTGLNMMIQSLESEKSYLKNAFDDLNDQNTKLNEKINDFNLQIEELKSERINKENDLIEQLNQKDQFDVINNQRQAQLDKKNKELRYKIDEMAQDKEYYLKQHLEAKQEVKNLKIRFEKQQQNLLRLPGSNVSESQGLVSSYKKKIIEMTNDYLFLQKENSKLREDIYNLREDRIRIMEKMKRSKRELDGKQVNSITEESIIFKKEKRIEELEHELNEREREIEFLIKNAKETGEGEGEDIFVLQQELNKAREEIKELNNKRKETIDLNDPNFAKTIKQDIDITETLRRLETSENKGLTKPNNSTQTRVKNELLDVIREYDERLFNKHIKSSLADLVPVLKEIIKESSTYKENLEHMEKIVEEANNMIMEKEHAMKDMQDQIDELTEAKEVLLDNIANN